MAITLAVDCMGGDHGPSVTIPAVVDFLQRDTDCAAILVGREEELRAQCGDAIAAFGERLSFQNASEVVAMDEAVSVALRNKRDSSMRVAVNLVKDGRADAAVSALTLAGLAAAWRLGWSWADPLAALCGAALIAHFATSLLKRAGAALLVMEVCAAPRTHWAWPDNTPLNHSKRRRT